MNGSWDHDLRAECSAWCDSYARPVPYPDPLVAGAPDPTQNPWRYCDHYYRIVQTDPDITPGTTPYCYDEIHDQATHPWQTREKWRLLTERTVVPSYVTVAWTFTNSMKDIVLGIRDGYNTFPGSKLTIVPQLFMFGDDPIGTGDEAMRAIDWYENELCRKPDGSLGRLSDRITPCYNVSNAPHKSERYAKAFSQSPGAVSAQWLRIMSRLADLGRYDAWIWGAAYRRIGEMSGVPSSAVRAWDSVLAAVYYSRRS